MAASIQILKVGSEWGTYTWADGFTPSIRLVSLVDEARKNPDAVINRLLQKGMEDLAEIILDLIFPRTG